jgi:hypothetical protein
MRNGGRCLIRHRYRWERGLAAAIAGGVLGAYAHALDLEQFSVGWPLELPADGDVFDVPMTREIYAHAADLDQIAILDAHGEPMSFYRVASRPPDAADRRAQLDASPIYAASIASTAAGIDITSGRQGTRLRVAPPPDTAESELIGFLIDASGVDWAPVAMELEWQPLEQPFLLDVTIEHSPTLASWRSAGRGPIASLRIDGTESRHTRLTLVADAGGYYRIVTGRSVPNWFLERVTLIGEAAQVAETLTAAIAPPGERTSSDGELIFDAGGPLPVTRIAFDFGDRNGWARASIASSASVDGPWRTRVASGLFYVAAFENQTFASEPISVGRVEDRFWRVRFAGSPRAAPPSLALEYAQESIRFAASGQPPYVLAAGTLTREAGPDPTFAAVWNALPPPGRTVPSATLGPMRELGGTAALVAPFTFQWATAALWAALGLGVLFLAVMAMRLAREMLAGEERSTRETPPRP